MNNLSVILCTYNEGSNIQQALEKLINRNEVDEIIIIDDSSTDDTVKIINSFNNNKIKCVVRKKAKGFASAFIYGLFISNGKYILRFDVDMHDDIDFFLNNFNKNQDFDCVIFSRYINGGGDLRNPVRKISSKLINILCSLILSKKIKDYTSCIMVFKRSVLKENFPDNTGYGNFIIEFTYNLILYQKKYLEIPYIQKKITELNSKTATNYLIFCKNGFYYLITILKCFLIKLLT